MQSFIVSERQNALVLNPANPQMLRTLLPMAKPFAFRGQTLYAVPHQVDVVRLLHNVGVQAPSPILAHYNWPGRYTPFAAQLATAAFLTLNPRAFVLSSLGTGKTNAVLWAYDYLRKLGLRRRLLVSSPLSSLERTWADTLFKDFPHLKFAVLYGSAARRKKLLANPFDVYIINHEGIEVLGKDLEDREDIDTVVLDELAILRNPRTDRYKAVAKVCAPLERIVWGMTGSPIPNAPTDAWAQIKLVDPTKSTRYFRQFRDLTMTKLNDFKYVPRAGAVDIVRQHMQPAIRFTREECVDLPETMYQTRHVELSSAQLKVYEEIRLRMKSEADEGTMRAVNEADKLGKLVQVAAGAVYTTQGEVVDLDNAGRLHELIDIIEQAEGKVIVFVPFVAALTALRAKIAEHYPTELVYGGVSKADRDTAFWRFQELPAGESRVLLANASAMSHSLTLTSANTIVWWAPTTSNETFEQSNGRITRPGQTRKTFIIMIEGTPVERKIYARLEQKQKIQGLLLDAVRESMS